MPSAHTLTLSLSSMPFWLVFSVGLGFFCLGCIVCLFRRIGHLLLQLERTSNAVSRLERDLSKHRYAIAVSAGETNTPEITFGKTDRQIIDDVIEQAETLAETKKPVHDPTSMKGLNDGEILDFLKKALANKGITVYQQPIVSLPGRKTHYYEVFSRIMVGDGSYIPANKFIAVAKNNNLVDAIDNILLMQCLQMLKNSTDEKQVEYFINVTSQTFSSKDYMTNLLVFLSANPKLSTRLIFEITQKDSLNLGGTAKTIMERLALLGCRFSMDQVMILGMDLDRLLDLNISFVKLDMNALQKDLSDTTARKRIKRIKNSLDVQGINVIIEKVENEKQLFNVLDMHFDTGQGYLFGKPELMA